MPKLLSPPPYANKNKKRPYRPHEDDVVNVDDDLDFFETEFIGDLEVENLATADSQQRKQDGITVPATEEEEEEEDEADEEGRVVQGTFQAASNSQYDQIAPLRELWEEIETKHNQERKKLLMEAMRLPHEKLKSEREIWMKEIADTRANFHHLIQQQTEISQKHIQELTHENTKLRKKLVDLTGLYESTESELKKYREKMEAIREHCRRKRLQQQQQQQDEVAEMQARKKQRQQQQQQAMTPKNQPKSSPFSVPLSTPRKKNAEELRKSLFSPASPILLPGNKKRTLPAAAVATTQKFPPIEPNNLFSRAPSAPSPRMEKPSHSNKGKQQQQQQQQQSKKPDKNGNDQQKIFSYSEIFQCVMSPDLANLEVAAAAAAAAANSSTQKQQSKSTLRKAGKQQQSHNNNRNNHPDNEKENSREKQKEKKKVSFASEQQQQQQPRILRADDIFDDGLLTDEEGRPDTAKKTSAKKKKNLMELDSNVVSHQKQQQQSNGKEKTKKTATAAPYVEVVRSKATRESLTGYSCPQCEKWYQTTKNSNGINGAGQGANRVCNHVSRHRYRFEPAATPPDFWKISFPDSQ